MTRRKLSYYLPTDPFCSLFGNTRIDGATLLPLEYRVPIVAVAGGHEPFAPTGIDGHLTDLGGEPLGPREVGAHA